ncbi:MAG: fused MFS/spermidine synthase [Acidobacteria bacterium]|nr:fused MFS/spermidine synthase [Acidobacteriota bacterium]
MSAANQQSTRPRARGRGALAPALVALALLAAAAGVVFWSLSARQTLGQLEHEETSAYSTIRVRRDGDVRLLTFVRDDGRELVQSRIDLTAPQTLASPYARSMFASFLYQPEPRRVLVVGLGGGAMVRFLAHHAPDVQVDAVEIDPAVVRLADQYFGVRSGGHVRVVTADAVAYIESTTERYDLIFMDAFLRPSSDTDATGVPSRLKTVAFLGRVKQALAPGGVVAFNINQHAGTADDIAAVTEAFGRVAIYGAAPADNDVVIATEGTMPGDDTLRARIGGLDARFGGVLSFAELLGRRHER